MQHAVLAGLDEELASPRCSDEEQHALAKITAACTLAKPHTIIALLSASVLDFDPEAMALTEPTGTVTLSVAEADEECMVAIRPRKATNVTLTFTTFDLGNYGYLRVYDGSNTAAPLLTTLFGDDLPKAVTSQSTAMLLVLRRDPSDNGGAFSATYRSDTAPLE